MEAALKLEPAGSVEDEVARLRSIFADAFPPSASETLPQGELIAEEDFPIAEGRPDKTDVTHDWTVTLGNIHLLIAARNAAEARHRDAEVRAERAEARAREAEHWLRRLHQAVLDGLPVASAPRQ